MTEAEISVESEKSKCGSDVGTSNRVSLNLNSPERGSKRGLCPVNVWLFFSNRSRRGNE